MLKLISQRLCRTQQPFNFNFFSVNNFGVEKSHNFKIDYLTNIEVITRDYSGSLIHLLQVFKEYNINLTCLETRKLSQKKKYQTALFSLTFDKVGDDKLKNLINDLELRFDKISLKQDNEVQSVPWFPVSIADLKDLGQDLLDVKDDINQDHPQFLDKEYRKRRDYIANQSKSHIIGQPIPFVDYTEKENETWRKIYKRLKEEHQGVISKRFSKNLEKVEKELGFLHKIPQLCDIDQYLQAETGIRIKAVHGILNQREFLNALGHKIFCCTQYIRHHETPEYTPEPDIVHEIVGHVPMFADKEIAQISQEIGILSCGAKNSQIASIGSLYWYTVEFGAHMENGIARGYGAGIASSIQECQNFHKAKFEKLNPFKHAYHPYPIQSVQPMYCFSETFEDSLETLIKFGKTLQKPFNAYYDEKSKEIKCDKIIKTYDEVDEGPKF